MICNEEDTDAPEIRRVSPQWKNCLLLPHSGIRENQFAAAAKAITRMTSYRNAASSGFNPISPNPKSPNFILRNHKVTQNASI